MRTATCSVLTAQGPGQPTAHSAGSTNEWTRHCFVYMMVCLCREWPFGYWMIRVCLVDVLFVFCSCTVCVYVCVYVCVTVCVCVCS